MTELIAPTITLKNGAAMPTIGLGTWPMDDAEVERAVITAVEAGYRLLDTAENYGNERGVGAGVRACGLPREELFITSKFNRKWHGRQLAVEAFGEITERLGVDYLDMLMIHWPNPDQDSYVDAFRGLIDLFEDGRIRAIGLSNFLPEHMQRILAETGRTADVNQIQLTPYHTQMKSRDFHREHGIVTESWRPLGAGGAMLSDPVIVRIAEAHGKTPAQVVLRWNNQQGMVPIPKSGEPSRQRANLESIAFDLSLSEIDELSALDGREKEVTDPLTFGH